MHSPDHHLVAAVAAATRSRSRSGPPRRPRHPTTATSRRSGRRAAAVRGSAGPWPTLPVLARGCRVVPHGLDPGRDLGERRRQRRQPEPQPARVAVVGDDVALATAAAVTSSIAGWRSVTWPPRRSGSRGEATSTPSGASSSSASSTAYVVSPIDFARIALDPDLLDQREHVAQRQHAEDRRRARLEPAHARPPARRSAPSGTGRSRRSSPGSAG